MFARWRNLAAAAGAFWLPFAFAQASPQLDDLHCTRPAACARYQDRTSGGDRYNFDQDTWYQRYYGNTLNETTSNDLTAPQSEDPQCLGAESAAGSDDEFSDQFTPRFDGYQNTTSGNEISDTESTTSNTTPEADSAGRCCDPTCPCHDMVDLDCDEEGTTVELETTRPEDASIAIEQQRKPGPLAVLCGTIEPIFDDEEEEALDGALPEETGTSTDSTIINSEESCGRDEFLGDGTLEACDNSESSATSEKPIYHMFYPGCDWSPYFPSVRQPAFDEYTN